MTPASPARFVTRFEVVKRLADSMSWWWGWGPGSYAVEALARGGAGHLTLVDFDVICE